MVPCVFCASKQREIFTAVIIQPKHSQEDRVKHLELELEKKTTQLNMLLDSLKSARKNAKEVSIKTAKMNEKMDTMKQEVHRLTCMTATLQQNSSRTKATNNALNQKNTQMQAELDMLNKEVQNMWIKQPPLPLWNYSLLFPEDIEKILCVKKDSCGLGTQQSW